MKGALYVYQNIDTLFDMNPIFYASDISSCLLGRSAGMQWITMNAKPMPKTIDAKIRM
jgi:hypothetical protein